MRTWNVQCVEERVSKAVFLMVGLATLMLTGCGEYRRYRLVWPANAQMEAVPSAQRQRLELKIKELNANLDRPILDLGGRGSGSPITVKIVDGFAAPSLAAVGGHEFAVMQWPQFRGTMGNRIAGRATLGGRGCTIELASFLLSAGASDELLQPVFWHEIGHCAGLPHVDESGELMSPLTLPHRNYTDSHLERFFNALWESVSLSRD